jgi:ribosomal protein L11 methylase PrmA
LAGLVAENGVLLLAGILQDQQHEILAAVKNHGLAVIDRIQMDDWLAFAALKS